MTAGPKEALVLKVESRLAVLLKMLTRIVQNFISKGFS